MSVCAKIISSWVRKVLSIAKAHISLVLPVVLWHLQLWGLVSLVSIWQTGDGARLTTQGRHYFSTYITTTDQHHN